MFTDAVLDHFRNPRNAGELPDADATVEVSNPVCGDILQTSRPHEGGRIAEARFLCRGCTTAIACASLLTEQLRTRTLAESRVITANRYLGALLAVFPPPHSTARNSPPTRCHALHAKNSRRVPAASPVSPSTALHRLRIIQIQHASLFRRHHLRDFSRVRPDHRARALVQRRGQQFLVERSRKKSPDAHAARETPATRSSPGRAACAA